MSALRALLALVAVLTVTGAAATPPEGAVRIATFNVSLARGEPGKLIDELRDPAAHPAAAAQVAALAEILRRVRPDVLLVQELDYDPAGEALALFEAALAESRAGLEPLVFTDRYTAPVNTGAPSGFDLDRDGKIGGPNDALGWGVFEGQFGMAVLSRFPIEADAVRSFRLLKMAATPTTAPWPEAPTTPEGDPYYAPEAWAVLPLSSKAHWDVPVTLPDGRTLHLLASHPTPPVFDGPEDRNGRRNAAEILFWAAYLDGAAWIVDDVGVAGGLPGDAAAVVLGDLNADPADGDGRRDAIAALLTHARLADPAPSSAGAAAASVAQGGRNAEHRGDAARDTADFKDIGARAPGNLRVDHVLPTRDLSVVGAGVFWPAPDDPLALLVAGDERPASSDHRLVWVDLALAR